MNPQTVRPTIRVHQAVYVIPIPDGIGWRTLSEDQWRLFSEDDWTTLVEFRERVFKVTQGIFSGLPA